MDSVSVHSRVQIRAIIQVTNSNIKILDIKAEEKAEVDTKADKVEEEGSVVVRDKVMLWYQFRKAQAR